MKHILSFVLCLVLSGLLYGRPVWRAQGQVFTANFLNQHLLCHNTSCSSPDKSGKLDSFNSDRRIHWDTSHPGLQMRGLEAQAQLLEREFRAELTPEEIREPDISVTRYTCPQQDTMLVERRYGKEAYIIVQLKGKALFKWEDYSGKNRTLYNHPGWITYMCGFSAEQFFKQRITPPLPQAMRPREPYATKANSAANTVSQAVQFMSDTFYPAKKTKNDRAVSRLFISKKKKEVQYLQFAFFTGYTAAEAEKDLKKKYDSVHTRRIICDATKKVIETASGGVYHLIQLTPKAMVTLQKPYNTQEDPSAQLLLSNRQYMCRYTVPDGLYPAGK